MPDLNQQVCEKLGIEGTIEHDFFCDLETYDHGNPWRTGQPKCTCTPQTVYPELATEAGFFVLIAALHRNSYGYELKSDGGPATASVYGDALYFKQSAETPQQALLMAAAKALEVPE